MLGSIGETEPDATRSLLALARFAFSTNRMQGGRAGGAEHGLPRRGRHGGSAVPS